MRPMHKPITRWQAFLIHLGISLVIFLVLAWIIVKIWYPFPFFQYDGGWQGIRIVAGVDLVLGPLLTLIVYKPGKKHLKLDLGIIAFIQAAALAWGVWITWYERPVAVVYTIDHFTPVTAGEMLDHGRDYRSLDDFDNHHPVLVYLDVPDDFDERQALLQKAISSRVPLYLFTERYRPIDAEAKARMIRESEALYDYLTRTPAAREALHAFYQIRAELPYDYLFIPLHSRYGRSVLVLERETLDYVGVVKTDATAYLKRRAPKGLEKFRQKETSRAAQSA